MNHFVPDFDTDDDYIIPGSSSSPSLNLPRKSAMAEEDIMELLWHNGQVVLHSQTQQRPNSKNSSSPPELAGASGGGTDAPPPPSQQQPPDRNLFIQEDEMASWLHYPLHEDDFCSDLLYSASASASASQPQSAPPAPSSSVLHAPPPHPPERPAIQVSAPSPPVPPERRTVNEPRTVRNFANFSRFRGNVKSGQPSSTAAANAAVRESPPETGSDVTRRTDGSDARWTIKDGATAAACEIWGMSSSKGKAERAISPPATETTEIAGDRKRKGREAIDESECRSEETKQASGSTSTKRSRAAEVHNLSERRRRDRINEKMRILQELIPHCNKSDKASMLDEAIEYMKSLQLQVQMMALGYGMAPPMMYPGMQQYIHQMGMMSRPFTPFPNMLLAAPSSLPTMAHVDGPAFPTTLFPVPNIHASDPSRVHLHSQQAEPALNSLHPQRPNQPLSGFVDPFQQFFGFHPMQASMLQNQATERPSSSKPSSSKEPEDEENPPAG